MWLWLLVQSVVFSSVIEIFLEQKKRGNPAQATILKCDCNAGHTHQDPSPDGLPPILYSMACHQHGASLVACRADPCG